MKRNGLLLAAFFFGLLSSSAIADKADDGTAPPAGIQPTTATLRWVLASFVRANRETSAPPASVVDTWTISRGGLVGTSTDVRVSAGSRSDETLGPLHTADGTYERVSWSQNENGEVVTLTGLHQRAEIDREALEDPLRNAADFRLLGVVEGTPRAYVVRLDPPGGRLEYIFFDTTTALIDRTEASTDGERLTTTYDDYRTTDGRIQAWHITTNDGKPENDGDYHLQSSVVNGSLGSDTVIRPAPTSPLSFASSPAKLPAQIIGDRIVVTAEIGDHKVNLLLDSGASGIVLNNAIVDALHLKTYGKLTGVTAGAYPVGFAVIPSMSLGNVTMRDTVVQSLPFAQRADDKTVVAGLLGFDFLDGVVLHIDYANGVVEALDPKTFVPPAGAKNIPIALDDQVPTINVAIASATGKHFIVDTGADRSALFSNFVAAHPRETADQGLGTEMQATYPFSLLFEGVGGTVTYQPLQVGPLSVAGVTFAHWLFQATRNAATFEREDFDGLIGQDVLRYFDVYFDYQHSVMYAIPNQRYRDRFGS